MPFVLFVTGGDHPILIKNPRPRKETGDFLLVHIGMPVGQGMLMVIGV